MDIKNPLFYNPGMLGDIIYSLPFCLSCVGTYRKEDLANNKFTLLLDTLIHHKNSNGDPLKNLYMLRDLLELQPYFKSVVCERHIDFGPLGALDLGAIRHGKVSMNNGDIVYRYRYLYPVKNFYRAEDPWLVLPEENSKLPSEDLKNKIVIFRSHRYNNSTIKYDFLYNFINDLLFVGLPHEYESFKNVTKFKVDYIKPNNFLEVASLLKNARFCIGNQTFYFALAESMKVPRLLELYKALPDVIPKGEWATEFTCTQDLEKQFELFYSNLSS